MEQGLCTIIVPAYNHENYIGECLDSLIGQTYDNIELILINDGSSDNTDNVIHAYEKKLKLRFKRYIYINQKNQGVCKTLNTGIALSKGEFINSIASDDYMLPEKVKKQIEILNQNQEIGVVYSDIYEVVSKGCLATYPLKEEEKYSSMYNLDRIGNGNVLNNLLTEVFKMPTPSVMIRRLCFEKVGYYDESLGCEDPDMFLRLAKEYSYFYLPEALVIHRHHGKNSGRNPEIIVPLLHAMYEKYKEVSWLTEEQKKKICETLRKCETLGNCIPINYFENVVTDKELIIWGTGSSYSNHKDSIKNEVAFFIDSNPKMFGKVIDGRTVYSPDKLHEINKEEYYVVIASSFRDEIKEELNDFGFIENIDYQ